MKYAADVIASVIFGIKVNSFENPQNKFWQFVIKLFDYNYFRHVLFQIVIFNPGLMKILPMKSFHWLNYTIFNFVKEVVDYREKNKITRNDFMQLLIQLKNKGEVNKDDNVKNTDVYNKSKYLY